MTTEQGDNVQPDAPDAPAVTGYRKLNAAEVDLINEIKAHAAATGALAAKVARYLPTVIPRELEIQVDARWLAIAQTKLQLGFMALNRSVARPEGFG